MAQVPVPQQTDHETREEQRQAALHRIAESNYGERMQRALKLVVQGVPFREAAAAENYADHSDLYRASRRLDLAGLHLVEARSQYQRIQNLANQALEKRLLEDPDSIGARDLAIVSGIASDKAERLGAAMSPAHNPLSQLFEMLHKGGKLEIVGPQDSTTVEGAEESEPPTIDITPASEPEASQ
jgi:hypothetical protein